MIVLTFLGLTVGLGYHVKDVSKSDLRKFNIVSATKLTINT